MIELLYKKHNKWMEYANFICSCPSTAKDLVQDMYLKVMQVDKEYNDSYVMMVIKNNYIDYVRRCSKWKVLDLRSIDGYIPSSSFVDKHNRINIFKITDRLSSGDDGLSDEDLEILERFKSEKWYRRILLMESQRDSIRTIAERYNINYGFVFREIKKARENILNKN